MWNQCFKISFSLVIFSFLCLFFTLPTYANDRTVVEKMTSIEMKKLITDEGFSDVTIDGDDDLIVKMNGYRVLVFVRGNNYTNIQYRFSIGGTSATLRSVNDWNRTKKFTKSYLDNDGDPVLEMDLDLDGGVTIAKIKDSILTFSRSQAAFLMEVAK